MEEFGLKTGVFFLVTAIVKWRYSMKNNVQLLQGRKKRLQINLNVAPCHFLTPFARIAFDFPRLSTSDEDCGRLRRQTEEESTHEATRDDNVLFHKFCSLERLKKREGKKTFTI